MHLIYNLMTLLFSLVILVLFDSSLLLRASDGHFTGASPVCTINNSVDLNYLEVHLVCKV